MKRYHIFKDGTEIAETATKETALTLIQTYQVKETHLFLKAEFSVIYGEVEYIPYKR